MVPPHHNTNHKCVCAFRPVCTIKELQIRPNMVITSIVNKHTYRKWNVHSKHRILPFLCYHNVHSHLTMVHLSLNSL
ncbi:hypothetical protein GDO86_008383 [Hymenochirus boettgeri]|uniref:Uncharacterized protein n=1 Tax=Hymenochirus boettgeri TaxID=247094 RepID=A0A8T2IXG1_9PIPI|nr:hypothetical protein GDO86_008383 [Hymenochirus boettgeri]